MKNNPNVHLGVISQIVPYGVYVQIGTERRLVHGPELSWLWPCVPDRHFNEGQSCHVWIGWAVINDEEVEIASFRRVYPEGQLVGAVLGDRLAGRAIAIDSKGVSAEFGVYRTADFMAAGLDKTSTEWRKITTGQAVTAEIVGIVPGRIVQVQLLGYGLPLDPTISLQ